MPVIADIRREYQHATIAELARRHRSSKDTIRKILGPSVRPKGTKIRPEEVMDMRAAYPKFTQAQIAQKWGYSQWTVHRLLVGKTHKHLPGAHTGANRRDASANLPTTKPLVNVHAKLLLHRL
jgi:hypothetical protein